MGEQTGILSSETFSGFGNKHNDPTYRLKLLARKHKYTDINNKKHKKIEGGAIPLIPIGLSILGSLAGKVISEIYDKVKKRCKVKVIEQI